MNIRELWFQQCEAARGIKDSFGPEAALAYLVGEKFINFLDAAETDGAFRKEIHAFVDEIRDIFPTSQLASYLEIARHSDPFDPTVYDDPEEAERERRREPRKSANELLLVERAREWLLED